MNPGWTLFVEVVATLASIAVILDYCGVKPNRQSWGLITHLSRSWKLAVMLGLMLLSLGFSGYGFYRSLHPRIVEKVVEKPVDRVVEKIVEAECPKPQPSPKHRHGAGSPPPPQIEQYGEGSGAVGAGINQGPCSVAQVGGEANQGTTNCTLTTPETIQSMVIALKLECEVRSGYAPAELHWGSISTNGYGVTLEGFPRPALLAPTGKLSRTITDGDKMTVEQQFSKDENSTVLGSAISDLGAVTALSFLPAWSDGNWCSRIVFAHASMIVNHNVIVDSDLPLDGGVVPEDATGQKYPTIPHLTVKIKHF
jgi:hypothetical protein